MAKKLGLKSRLSVIAAKMGCVGLLLQQLVKQYVGPQLSTADFLGILIVSTFLTWMLWMTSWSSIK